MPKAPRRPCQHAGCKALTEGRYCEQHAAQHKPKAWATTEGSASSRGYGAAWRRLRTMILNRDPICVLCDREPASEVDHIVSKAKGGQDTEENLQGLCRSCHASKTGRES